MISRGRPADLESVDNLEIYIGEGNGKLQDGGSMMDKKGGDSTTGEVVPTGKLTPD